MEGAEQLKNFIKNIEIYLKCQFFVRYSRDFEKNFMQ